MEEQTDAPKQAPSGEKIFDELPTFVAPVTTALGGAAGEHQATRYDLNDNFSIFKVDDDQQKPPPEEAAQKNLDFSNPDAFVIGQPPTQNYVHLDFDLDPLASSATVSTPPQASTAITKANLLDDDLDDWSTEAHKQQPIISATEQSSFTEPPKPLEQVGVNVTNIMETSCIDNLLADLPEETDEEEDEASNRSSNNNNNQNESDWYLKETHVKEKESSSFLHEESIVTTSNVVFEPSEPEAVSLPPSSGSPDRPQQQQQQFTYGDTSLESSLRTSTEVKEMSFEESSSLWSTSSVTQTTTTAITGEPQEPQQQQPNSPVTSESGAPKSTRSRPSQPPPPPPPATMSSSSSSDLDDGHRGGGAQKSPEQSEQNKPAELWTFDSPAAGSGGQASETTIASASSSSFFSSAAPVVTETVAAAVLPPLPSSPPSWSTSAAPVAPVATTAVADNTTTARQASVDDDVSNSSSSSYPQEEQQPTSAEAIFSSLGSSFVPPSPPSPPSVQLQSSTSAVPPPPVPSVKEEEEVVVETKKKTESETLSWSPPSPVKEVPPKEEEVVVKQSPAFEAPKQQQLKSSSSSTTMGRKNRRDNSSDDGADHAAGSDQIREYIENVLGPNVAELVYWRDLKHSGAAFGLGLVLLFSLTFFSVISVVAYTLFFTLLASFSFRVYKNVMQAVQKTGEGHPFKEYLEIQITPSQERIHEIVESAIVHGTTFINRLRSVLLVEDIVDSLKYLVIFWAFTYIGAWFNGLTVIILLYLGAFSLPLLYEQNRPLIDQYLELANSKITEISDKVPFLKKAVAAAPAEKKDE